jgi:hypothetical protein
MLPLVGQYVFIVRYHAEHVCTRVSTLCGQNAVLYVKPALRIVLILLQKA